MCKNYEKVDKNDRNCFYSSEKVIKTVYNVVTTIKNLIKLTEYVVKWQTIRQNG